MEQKKGFKYFIQKHIKRTMPDYFPEKGNWITLELKDANNTTIVIPALLIEVKKRKLRIKTRIPVPEDIRRDGFLYCSFEVNEIEKDLFQDVESVRHTTHFEFTGKGNKNNEVDIKLTDGIFKRVERREFQRLNCKKHYNITVNPVPVEEINENNVKYNRYMKRFFEKYTLKDLCPGGISGLAQTKYASQLKAGHKIKVKLCFGKRNDYQYTDQLFASETTPIEITTALVLLDKVDRNIGTFIRFQSVHDIKSRYLIINESFKMRQSDASLATSCVNENRNEKIL